MSRIAIQFLVQPFSSAARYGMSLFSSAKAEQLSQAIQKLDEKTVELILNSDQSLANQAIEGSLPLCKTIQKIRELTTENLEEAEEAEETKKLQSAEAIINCLLEKGANVSAVSSGHTALHLAAKEDKSQDAWLFNQLADHKTADMNQKDSEGNTPLHCALKVGNLGLVNGFLAKEYDEQIRVQQNNGAGSSQKSKKLDLDIANNQGETLLHGAVQLKDGHQATGMIQSLIQLGVNPNQTVVQAATTNTNTTPLHLAAEKGTPEAIQALMFWTTDNNNYHYDSLNINQPLLDAGDRNTPLHLAAKAGKIENIAKLIEWGC